MTHCRQYCIIVHLVRITYVVVSVMHPLQPKHTLAQRHFCPITSLFYLFNSKIKETYGPQQFCQILFRWKILIFWHYMVKKSGWKYFHCSQLPNQWTWNTFIYSVVQSVNWKYFHCSQQLSNQWTLNIRQTWISSVIVVWSWWPWDWSSQSLCPLYRVSYRWMTSQL